MTIKFPTRPSVLPTPSATPSIANKCFSFLSHLASVACSPLRLTTAYAKSAVSPSEEQKYSFSYRDAYGLDKKYLAGQSRLVKAENMPFEPESYAHFIGKGNPQKMMVRETTSAVEVIMKDSEGELVRVCSHFVHYSGSKGQATLMPNGEVDFSAAQHMKRNMLPGMARKPGEFVEFEIPPHQLQQTIRGTFSSFSPLDPE